MRKKMSEDERFYDGSTINITDNDLLTEPDYAGWEQKKSMKHYWMPLTLAGMGIFVLAIIFAWIFIKPQDPGSLRRLEHLETRLADLEKKLSVLETLDARLIAQDTQNQKFQSAVDRFDQAEASMSLRMDLLTKEVEKLQNTAAQPEARVKSPETAESNVLPQSKIQSVLEKPEPPVTPVKQPPAEHEVAAGETLYSISRNYGLTVTELLKYNGLAEGATIYPGQKLVISPPR